MKVESLSANVTRQHLHRFAECGCDAAFRAIFDSHAGLVYHAALRAGRGDRHLAEDVVQTVFTSLARKASTFSPRIILPAWLHRHACLTTRQMMRSARRRQAREEASALWRQDGGDSPGHIAELIDEALNSLPDPDRAALALRFLDNRDLRSVGRELGVSEDAAQKRVSRGLDRLRAALERRGVKQVSMSTAGALLSAPAGGTLPNLSPLASASLLAASSPAALPTLAGAIAFLVMKKSTVVIASILVVLAGTAAITLTQRNQPSPASASEKPESVRGPADTRDGSGEVTGPENSGLVRSRNFSQARRRLEISSTTGPHFPKRQVPPNPAPEYDQATRDAFRNHPLAKIAQSRLNTMRSVTQKLLNRMTAEHKDHQRLYQDLRTRSTNPQHEPAARTRSTNPQHEPAADRCRAGNGKSGDGTLGRPDHGNRN